MNKSLDIQVTRKAIKKITRMLSNKGIDVVMRGTEAMVQVDKKGHPVRVYLPYIPDNASQGLIDAINGFLDHEVGHMLFTDFNLVNKAFSESKDLAETFNIVEDTYIERMMAKKFRGSGYNLSNVGKFYLEKFVEPKLNEALEKGDESEAASNLFVAAMRAKAGHDVFKEFMDKDNRWELAKPYLDVIDPDLLDALPNIKSSEESFDLARKINKCLKPGDDEKCDSGEREDGESGSSESSDTGESSGSGSSDSEGDEGEGKGGKGSTGKDEGENSTSSSSGGDDDSSDDDDEEEESSGSSKDDEGESPDEDEDSKEETSKDEEGDEDEEDKGASGEDEEEDDESSKDEDEEEDDESSKDEDEEEDDESSEKDLSAPEKVDNKVEEAKAEPDKLSDDEYNTLSNGMKSNGFDDALSKMISEDTESTAVHSDYLIYSDDFDVVETYVPTHFEDSYLEALDSKTREMTGQLQKHMERLVIARSQSRWQPGMRRGRLNSAALYRLKTNDDRVFRQRHIAENKDSVFSLVVDTSGSMACDRYPLAIIAAYALASVLDRLNVPCEVSGFTTGDYGLIPSEDLEKIEESQKKMGRRYSRIEPIYIPIYKGFNENMSIERKRRFAAAPYCADFLRNNIDGESIMMAASRLIERDETNKVMIVMSDGQPAAYGERNDLRSHLKKSVKDITAAGIKTVGIGIQSEAVKQYYPQYVVLEEISDLPGTIMKTLQGFLL